MIILQPDHHNDESESLPLWRKTHPSFSTTTNMNYHLHTLDNGIRLLYFQKQGETGYCGMLLNTGSRDEFPEEEGVAHLIEHLLFKGTKKRNAFQILSRMENKGGEINAFTTKEETFLYTSFFDEDLPRALELMADMVFDSQFPEPEIKKETDVILDEIHAYEDNPVELIYDEFENVVFPEQSLGHFILGDANTLRSMNRDQIRNFYLNHYFTDEIILVYTGNRPLRQFLYFAEKHLGQVPARLRKQPRKLDSRYIPADRNYRKGTNQSHCIVGYPSYPYTHPGRYAMLLTGNILGGQGLNSWLNLSLREKRGLAYTIESSNSTFADTGVFGIYFGTERNNLAKSLDLIQKDIHRLQTKRLGPLQLDRAKKQLKGIIVRHSENFENRLPGLARSILYFGRALTLKEKLREIDEITAGDILKTANELFAEKYRTVITFE